eukprot:SAG11_NODE_4625_length_1830_cov_1.476025_2_plen_149_part_00
MLVLRCNDHECHINRPVATRTHVYTHTTFHIHQTNAPGFIESSSESSPPTRKLIISSMWNRLVGGVWAGSHCISPVPPRAQRWPPCPRRHVPLLHSTPRARYHSHGYSLASPRARRFAGSPAETRHCALHSSQLVGLLPAATNEGFLW